MRQSEYIENSGALGALAQAFQAYQGGKMERRANVKISDFAERIFAEQARAEQARAQAALQSERDQYRWKKETDAKFKEPERPEYTIVERGGQSFYVPKQPPMATPTQAQQAQ